MHQRPVAVIVGHTPELLDGNRSREPLTVLFGVLSLGEVVVDGFFLISGYLLTASLLSSPSLSRYFVNRITRIYPGFLVAFFVCVFLVAPVAGAPSVMSDLLQNVIRAVLLQPPQVGGAFAGAAAPVLDGAMWTIGYEFCCYIGLATLFFFGVLKRSWTLFLVVGVVLVVLLLRLNRLRKFGFTNRLRHDSIGLSIREGMWTNAWCRSSDWGNVQLP